MVDVTLVKVQDANGDGNPEVVTTTVYSITRNGTSVSSTTTQVDADSDGNFETEIVQTSSGTVVYEDTNDDGFYDIKTTTTPSGTTVEYICFLEGTLIATPDGEVNVESLKAGDLVKTVEGRSLPVRWVGRQTVSTTFADPERSLPVLIKAGALAEGVPARDLYVSQSHAMYVDGVLAHANALVNGVSIVRQTRMPETFSFYNIELAEHALILAEGAPAESYVDNVSREHFDNWAEREALGELAPIAELDLPRAKSARQIPAAIRVRLAARAAELFGAESAAA